MWPSCSCERVVGQRPRVGNQRDARGPCRDQCLGGFTGGRSCGEHVVDQEDAGAFQHRSDPGGQGERACHIRAPLRGVHRRLRGTRPSAYQQLAQHQRTGPGVAFGEQAPPGCSHAFAGTAWSWGPALRALAPPLARERERRHSRSHERRQFRPPLVLERVSEVIGGRREHISIARRGQRGRPVPAAAALQIARASRAAGKVTPPSAWPRRHLESGPTSGAHERRRAAWHPDSTGYASGRQQQIGEVRCP